MLKLWSISHNTFLQTIRQPVYTVLVLVTFAVLIFTLPFSGYTLSVDFQSSDQQQLEELGLATLRVMGLLIAAFSASGVLRREIEEKTALIVLTKPISRTLFVVGKFLGVLAAVAVAYYLCSLVMLMTVRHRVVSARSDPIDWPVIVIGFSALGSTILLTMLGNLFFGWPFTSTGVWLGGVLLTAAMVAIAMVGKDWEPIRFGAGLSPQLLLEMAMMFMAVVVFVALAVTASTRLGQAMTLLVCVAVFLLGSAHPQIFGYWKDQVPAARVVGWFAPNFSIFYPRDDIQLRQNIPSSVVVRAGLYSLLYTAGLLAVGVGLFQTRELEAQRSGGAIAPLVNVLAWVGCGAALVGAAAGIVILALPRLYSLGYLLLAGGLIVAGGLGWLIWGAFGYGRRWSYWVVLAACVVSLPLGVVSLLLGGRFGSQAVAGPVAVLTELAFAAGMLIVLLLPKTRRHFGFGRRSRADRAVEAFR